MAGWCLCDGTGIAHDACVDTKAAIREFLVSRRTRLRPRTSAYPWRGVRRVEGLRREEVAALANVSVDQYVRLERGQASRVSDAVIDAVAVALRLTANEHRYLRTLARPATPPRQAAGRRGPVRPSVQLFLDSMRCTPAYLVGHCGAILAWNHLAAHAFLDFADVPEARRTLGRLVFTDPRARDIYVDWPTKARETVAYLRTEAAARPHDPEFARQIARLRQESPEFADLWDRHSIMELTHDITRLRTRAGTVELSWDAFQMADDAHEFIVVYTPTTPAAAATLARLESEPVDGGDDSAGPRAGALPGQRRVQGGQQGEVVGGDGEVGGAGGPPGVGEGAPGVRPAGVGAQAGLDAEGAPVAAGVGHRRPQFGDERGAAVDPVGEQAGHGEAVGEGGDPAQ